MAHLGARLARDVAPSRTGLIINAFFIEGENGDRRLLGGFSNMKIDPSSKAVSVTPSFEYTMQELTNPIAFANGSGAATVLADGHFATMQHHLSVRSTRATEHMGLLAAINRRAAARDRLVSPASHVAFISARRPTPGASGGRFASQSRTYTFRGESAPIAMPFLLAGVDLTPMMLFTQRLLEATKRGEQPPPDMTIEEWNRHLRRRD
jgi:hypothetical protein